ncbi:unnamed protein product [Heligmosomoides polygyrus]|uniref:DUF5655 domain-containing protein n=1 Tax=Heligmosomoides polygyrus TaxID=6339 RepID=A0A183FZI8_HELPZ|nr:unnamed protein product [Heligmosomoides polygyrus]
MALFKRITYSGDADMLRDDLLEALDTDVAIVRRRGAKHSPHASWLADVIGRYLAAKLTSVRCVQHNAAEYKVEVGHSSQTDSCLKACLFEFPREHVMTIPENP